VRDDHRDGEVPDQPHLGSGPIAACHILQELRRTCLRNRDCVIGGTVLRRFVIRRSACAADRFSRAGEDVIDRGWTEAGRGEYLAPKIVDVQEGRFHEVDQRVLSESQ
jgi:hypothetical protein